MLGSLARRGSLALCCWVALLHAGPQSVPESWGEEKYAADTLAAALIKTERLNAHWFPKEPPVLLQFESGHQFRLFDPNAEQHPHTQGLQSRVPLVFLDGPVAPLAPYSGALVQAEDQPFIYLHVPQKWIDERQWATWIQRALTDLARAAVVQEHPEWSQLPEAAPDLRANRLAMMELETRQWQEYLRTQDNEFMLNALSVIKERRRLMDRDAIETEQRAFYREGLPLWLAQHTLALFFPGSNAQERLRHALAPEEPHAWVDWAYQGRLAAVGAVLWEIVRQREGHDLTSVLSSQKPLETWVAEPLQIDSRSYRSRVASMVNEPDYRAHVDQMSDWVRQYEQQAQWLQDDYEARADLKIHLITGQEPVFFEGVVERSYWFVNHEAYAQRNVSGLLFQSDKNMLVHMNEADLMRVPGEGHTLWLGEPLRVWIDNAQEPLAITAEDRWGRPFQRVVLEGPRGRVSCNTPGLVQTTSGMLTLTWS